MPSLLISFILDSICVAFEFSDFKFAPLQHNIFAGDRVYSSFNFAYCGAFHGVLDALSSLHSSFLLFLKFDLHKF